MAGQPPARYHLVIYVVPDRNEVHQVPVYDEEFDSVTGITDLSAAADDLIAAHKAGDRTVPLEEKWRRAAVAE